MAPTTATNDGKGESREPPVPKSEAADKKTSPPSSLTSPKPPVLKLEAADRKEASPKSSVAAAKRLLPKSSETPLAGRSIKKRKVVRELERGDVCSAPKAVERRAGTSSLTKSQTVPGAQACTSQAESNAVNETIASHGGESQGPELGVVLTSVTTGSGHSSSSNRQPTSSTSNIAPSPSPPRHMLEQNELPTATCAAEDAHLAVTAVAAPAPAGATKSAYPCPQCTRTFATPSQASSHVRRLHEAADAGHICDVCYGMFPRASIAQHWRTHARSRSRSRGRPATPSHQVHTLWLRSSTGICHRQSFAKMKACGRLILN